MGFTGSQGGRGKQQIHKKRAGSMDPALLLSWWAQQGLNLRPLPCEGCKKL